jgi:hypothetical protein
MFKLLKDAAGLTEQIIGAALYGIGECFAPQLMTAELRLRHMEHAWMTEAKEAERLCYPVTITVLVNGKPTEIHLQTITKVTEFKRVIGRQTNSSNSTVHFDSWQILAIRKCEMEKKDAKPKGDTRPTAEA